MEPRTGIASLGGSSCAVHWYDVDGAWNRFFGVAALCLAVSLLLQVAVNLANDYSDGVRGSDRNRCLAEEVSGKPRRLVASGVVPPSRVLAVAVCVAVAACVCGIAVAVMSHQYWLVALGVMCVAAGWWYSGGRHPYGHAGFGELSAVVFFGPVATLGTQFAIRRSFDGSEVPMGMFVKADGTCAGDCGVPSWLGQGSLGIDLLGVLVSLCIGMNAALIMLVNNIRDIEDDRVAGKRTVAVRWGLSRAVSLMEALIVAEMTVSTVVMWWGLVQPGEPIARTWTVGMLWLAHILMPVLSMMAVRVEEYRKALLMAGMNAACAVVYVAVGCIW